MMTSTLEKNIPVIYGLSTDIKPTGITTNGTAFFEMDTGKVFMYDEAGNQWVELG